MPLPPGMVFDMDGVLLDTEKLVLQLWDQVLHRHNISLARQVLLDCIGLNIPDTKRVLAAGIGEPILAATLFKEVNDLYQQTVHQGELPLKAGARELLAALSEVRLVVATSTATELARAKLKRVALLDFFETVVGGDQVSCGKPAPDIYRRAVSFLRLPTHEVVAVEDSAVGAQAASAAGLRVLLIPDIAPVSEEIRRRCWRVVRSLTEVLAQFA